MAEASDRPPEGAFAAPVEVRPAPAPTAPPAGEAPKPYSSLSLFAILGFALAFPFPLIVAVGAMVALFYRAPLLLPLWVLLFPAGAAFLCWLGRTQIRSSEGAQGGLRLTTWGLGLSFFFALSYIAYYAADYIAVTQQADAFGSQWLKDLQQNRVEQAFLATIPPPRPADDEGLRRRLEIDYNHSERGGPGRFSQFRRSELTRGIQEGAADTRVELVGVKAWSHEADGYHVDLTYHVSTPFISSDVMVKVVGSESRGDDYAGRQWYVKDYGAVPPLMTTPEGLRFQDLMKGGVKFMGEWRDKLAAGDWDEAYLDTVPPEDRARRRQVALAGPWAGDSDYMEYLEGREAFRDGVLVRADAKGFWSPEGKREKVLAEARATFSAPQMRREALMAELESPPTRSREGQTVRLGYDAQMILFPDFGLEALVVLETDAADMPAGDRRWRVHSLELVNAKSLPQMPAGMPGIPGMPPPRP